MQAGRKVGIFVANYHFFKVVENVIKQIDKKNFSHSEQKNVK